MCNIHLKILHCYYTELVDYRGSALYHLHIIVIVVLEKKVVEVVVKTNEKVVAEAKVVVKSNEKVVAEADVFNEKVVAKVIIRMNEILAIGLGQAQTNHSFHNSRII